MSRDDLFPVDDVAPAVFGAEHEPEAADESEPGDVEPPETVYVPAEPVEAPQDEVIIQLSRTEDDDLVLLAFSSPERLAVCLGDEQPWLAVPKVQIEAIRQRCEATCLELDPVLPQD
ncbi:SAV_915 family protein [Saccharopolyspora halophila]|uniref:SAV_915 family protein n=1 Tax=Saccharopolyspora halophila TaxID=405551 RepID=UPI0031D57A6A